MSKMFTIIFFLISVCSHNLSGVQLKNIQYFNCKNGARHYIPEFCKYENSSIVVYKDYNNLLHIVKISSSNKLILSEIIGKDVNDFAVNVTEKHITVIWTEFANRFIKYKILKKETLKSFFEKQVYSFRSISVYDLKLVVDNKKIALAFIEQYLHHSNLKFILFNQKGELLYSKTISDKGYNISPVIKKYKDSYFILWNNINGEQKRIFYNFYRFGKTGENRLLTDNKFDNIAPSVVINDNSIYIAWQDNRLGNWNISFAVLRNYNEKDIRRLTSDINNYWQPQLLLYKNRIFLFWLDEINGSPQLAFKSYDFKYKLWSGKKYIENIKDIKQYNVIAGIGILLFFKKKNKIYFSGIKHPVYNLNLKKIVNNDEIIVNWNNNFDNIDKFIVDFSIGKQNYTNIHLPVFNKSIKNFYCYVQNISEFSGLYFNIRYKDVMGIMSKISSISLIENRNKKNMNDNRGINWKNVSGETVYYNFIKNKIYYNVKFYHPINKEEIISKLYFHAANCFSPSKNKFISLFDTLNENLNFNRFVVGDSVLLPMLWGNKEILTVIESNINTALERIETKFKLQDKGYIYYIVSADLKSILKRGNAAKGDFIVILLK